jgi:magnesium transporter
MGEEPGWVDLLDPDEQAVRESAPVELDATAVARLVAKGGERRPTLESFGTYVVGTLLAPVVVPDENFVFYQEVGFVLTHDELVTVRKTPPGRSPIDLSEAEESCRSGEPPAMHVFHLIDAVAERYIDLTDDINAEIDEIEDNLDTWSIARIRDRVVNLRHDLLHLRRVLSPTRDSVRQIVDGRLDLEGEQLFTREVELHFADVYDKLLRASDALDLARDLLANVRDAYQTKIAFNQNAAHARRLAASRADLHRRALRPELPQDARIPVGRLGLCLVVGPDHRHDPDPGLVLPSQEVDLATAGRSG